MRRRWRVVLADAADVDFASILEWTAEQFGKQQASTYAGVLLSAVDALEEGPGIIGVRRSPHLGRGLFIFHAARHGRRARHLLVFQAEDGAATITILRILRDSMDIARHLPETPED